MSHASGPTGQDGNDVGLRSSVFEPIAHSALRSFDPVHVSKFLKEYSRYSLEVEEKRKEVPSMTVASYKVCIERSRL